MRRVNNKNDAYKNMFKVAKRIAITMLCCIPVMIAFAYLTRHTIKGALQVVCFMLIMGIAVAIVEFVARANEKKRKEEIETKRDVFK
jgi:undecaprenyl pyrophosphate phosphatase UppP